MNKSNLFSYILEEKDEGKKLEHILYHHFHFSRKVLQKLKIGENVWLDGNFVYLNTRGKTGQKLEVNLSNEELSTVQGEDLELDILYEDAYFLAVNKPPGQVIHPISVYKSGTLANAVVGYWERHGVYRPFRPISRIDRNTSGIVLIANNRFAHQQLAWLSRNNQVLKKYLGLVEGIPAPAEGKIEYSLGLEPGSKIKRQVQENGLPSVTLFRTLNTYNEFSLVEFTLVTGRTHQIRTHCQAIGHPLLGDDLYGGKTILIPRQALHCSTYSFIHPGTGEKVNIKADLPQDIKALIQANIR